MSRELSFRAWDEDTKEMQVQPYISCLGGGGIEIEFQDDDCNFTPRHNAILMQYTGLQDKKKKDGYEADIIQTYFADGKRGDLGYLECTNLGSLCVVVKGRSVPIPLYFYGSWEIIGNIHENPDLLK